jgi:hypothetical protein
MTTTTLSHVPAYEWRALTALDTGGRGVRMDVLVDTQAITFDQLLNLEHLGLVRAGWDGYPNSRIDLEWARVRLPMSVRLKLTRAGLRMAHSPENMIRRAFRSPKESPTVEELRNRAGVSRPMVLAVQKAGQIEVLFNDQPVSYDVFPWTMANDRALRVTLTAAGRAARPLGGFR